MNTKSPILRHAPFTPQLSQAETALVYFYRTGDYVSREAVSGIERRAMEKVQKIWCRNFGNPGCNGETT